MWARKVYCKHLLTVTADWKNKVLSSKKENSNESGNEAYEEWLVA